MKKTSHGRHRALWCGAALLGAVALGGLLHLTDSGQAPASAPTGRLVVFAGAASQPATSEVAEMFTRRTGIQVDCSFGGSGTMLNQIRMEHFGDLYIPGSNDYMDKAEADELVDPSTRKTICWLRPVICVPKGNPKGIRELAELSKPGMRVAIGDPRSVCLGSIAKAAMEKLGIYEAVRPRIVTFASDCQQIANLIRMGEVDAAVGYDVFQKQSPEAMDCITIAGAQPVSVPVAVLPFAKHRELAMRFAAFISGPEGREVFARHGYTTDQP
jgi:molybdate transport system substrate-binding protein